MGSRSSLDTLHKRLTPLIASDSTHMIHTHLRRARGIQMVTCKIRSISKMSVVVSYALIFISVFTLPHFERAEPNPYFQYNNMPPAYWIGVSTSLIGSLLSVFTPREGNSYRGLGLSGLFSLVLFTNVIPKLMYRNQIWLDTYPYVNEVVNILNTNHVGAGQAIETPSLSLFTSQLALITGLDYIVVVEFISLLIPLIIYLLTYLLAKLFIGDRAAVITVLVYLGLNSFGLWFHRGSFSLMIQLITWYCFIKLIITRLRSWYALMLLSFVLLTLSHPLTSFFVIVSIVAPLILIRIRSIMLKLIRKDQKILGLDIFNKIPLSWISLGLFLIWSSWFSILHNTKFLMGRIYKIFKILPSGPASIISPTTYTSGYYIIVLLSFYELVFGIIIGSILTIFYVFKKKFDWKLTILSSWFLSAMFVVATMFVLKLSEYADRPFKYSFPALGMLIGWFIVRFDYKSKKKTLAVMGKVGLFMILSSFIIVLPLTMYSFMSFVYPSTSNLQFDDFLTKKAHGLVGVIGGHEDIFHYVFKNNAQAKFEVTYNTNLTTMPYNVIAVTFRAYAKDAYLRFQPPMLQSLKKLDEKLTTDPTLNFARIYTADHWQFIYANNTN